MIYLLGGPPRVGKSIISRSITASRGINVVSTDSLGAVLEAVQDPEMEPDLFIVSRLEEMPEADEIALLKENATERIRHQVLEGRAVWKAVEPFILTEAAQGRDLVIEGVAVLPELVHQLVRVDLRAIFVGNQAGDHNENIRTAARENEHDWLRHTTDEYIDAFATFVVEMSRFTAKEARRYGFEYVEMGGRPFSEGVAAAVNALLR